MGLRYWTIRLDSGEQVAEVRGRVERAGLPVEADAGGFLVRDPWNIAVRIEADGATGERSES